jgi:hypothetical protein
MPSGQCNVADGVGKCAVVTGICPAIYMPVCGCDGKTYPSDCDRRAARAQLDHTGECSKKGAGPGEMCGGIAGIQCNAGLFCDPPAGACMARDVGGTCQITTLLCTKDFKPVCGCDGTTYANDCLRLQAKVGKQADGSCQTKAMGLTPGVWAAANARLTVKDPSVDATFELSCGQGTIQAPLTLGPDGSFKWPGTISFAGGPIRLPPPQVQSAIYFGKVTGDTLALQVLVDGNPMPLSFTLVLNGKANIVRCL